jgi:hypothetical protein
VVVLTMDRNPVRRRVLRAARTQQCEAAFEPERANETAMGEKPMEAEIDAEHAEDEKPGGQQNDARPAEEPGDGGEYRDQMNGEETIDVVSLPSHHTRVDCDQPAEHAMQTPVVTVAAQPIARLAVFETYGYCCSCGARPRCDRVAWRPDALQNALYAP